MVEMIIALLDTGVKTSTGHLLALFAPILMIADIGAIYAYRNDMQKDIIRRMSGPMVVGMIVGFILLGKLPDSEVKVSTGVALLMLSMTFYFQQLCPTNTNSSNRESLLPLNGDELSKNNIFAAIGRFLLSTTVIGLISGILTVIANIAGPIIAVYLIQLQLPKRQLNGTRALLFLLANLVKIPAQIYLGNLELDDIFLVIPLATIAASSTFFTEAYIMPLVDQRTFERLSWALVSFGALKLIFHQ